jgi:phosphopantothenoylcysteine decarboxylase / phosphopantothenate---cysteine ligase
MKNVLLGVSGSVAAYRAADIARDLMRAGCQVRVCLTDGAAQFVTPTLFEALTGQPCLVDTFEEPEPGRMAHIDWARWTDLMVIAPATANTMNSLAAGLGMDMLTTLALAYTGPILIAPAMNPAMYSHETTQTSLRILRSRGFDFVEPVEGDVACGENGQGKLAANSRIVAEAISSLQTSESLLGQKVLITSGPTQEAIDDVRFLSNRSSGRMGAALARAALMRGADVVVVSGPVNVMYPFPAGVVPVRSALEMEAAVLREAVDADWIIGCAAVADYRPAVRHSGKLRRSADSLSLELVPNPDIIAAAAKAAPDAKVVGFAAEPSSDLVVARQKLETKGLVALAANDVSVPGIGFESSENALSLLLRTGEVITSGQRSKLECADWLWDELTSRLG